MTVDSDRTDRTQSDPLARLSYKSLGMYLAADAKLFEKLLTVSDVESVTGFTGVRQVPFNPANFLGSDLNFVTRDSRKILSVEFSEKGQFNAYRGALPSNFKTPLTGIGQEAFLGRDVANRSPYLLVFSKGEYAVSLTAAATQDSRHNMLNADQLTLLARIIAERLA